MTATIGHRIRKTRRRLGWTLQDLADRSGFTRSLMSKIENGRTVPPVATLMKIAAAMGVAASTLVDDEASPSTVLSRGCDDAGEFVLSEKGYRFRMLASGRGDKVMQPILFEAEKGRIVPQTLSHGGEEFVYVLEGRMRYKVGDAAHDLGPGDSLYFDAEQPHELEPVTKKVRFLAVFSEAIIKPPARKAAKRASKR